MNHFTLKEIRLSLPVEKNKADSFWTRGILRPLSLPVSWVFLRLGLRANTVSYISAVLCLFAGFFYASGSFSLQLIGVVLFNLFAVFDCADGNMARVTKTSGPQGGWADALGGYIAYVAVLLSLGVAAAGQNSPFASIKPAPEFWVLLGGLAASANLLMRLAYQGYRNISNQQEADVKKAVSLEKTLSENLGITGILMPLLLLILANGLLGYLLVFYTLFYGGGCFLTLVKLIRKVENDSRKK